MSVFSLIGVCLLLCCSAFFSGGETAFTSANRLRLKRMTSDGDRKAKLAERILSQYDAMLSTILFGNNLVNIAASSIVTTVALALGGEAAVTAASVLLTVIVLLVGEITPKIVAKRLPEQIACAIALPLYAVMTVCKPLVWLSVKLVALAAKLWDKGEKTPTITEAELAEIINTIEDEGVIDEEKGDLLQSALEFDDLTAEMAMTPRVEMSAIDVDDPPEESLKLVLECGFSRIPVYEDTIDHIIGILPANHYLLRMARDGAADIRALLAEPLRIHKTMKLDDVLKRMRRKHCHFAVVLDEYGGTLGLLTMEDVLEQIVGEIWDEGDEIVEACVETAPGVFEVSGMMSLHDFFDEIDYSDRGFDSEYTTVGGWAVEMLDAQPEAGQSFAYRDLRVTVLAMDGLRVARLRVERAKTDD